MSPEQLQNQKFKLESSLHELRSRLVISRGGELDRVQAAYDHYNRSDSSHAQLITDKDLDFQLSEIEIENLNQVELALLRIQSNTYGLCLTCHKLIALERLIAMPEARLCISCESIEHQL
jgi:DnaK suppressor protein